MPSSKKPDKEKTPDQKQKSLVSFVDDKTNEIKETHEQDSLEEKVIEEEVDLKEETEILMEESQIKSIPQKLFFKGNPEPFGLKKDNIKLEKVFRESVSSKYIRYLIKKGEIIQNLERGLLLDVDYDGGQNKAYCKFYDLDSDEIKIWIDTTGHEPYCLSKEPISELKNLYYSERINEHVIQKKITEYDGFKRFEEIKRYDLINDKEIEISKIYGKTPTNIGGSGLNIKNILGKNDIKAWEADIRYHLNYIYDIQLIPGLIYKIKNGKIERISFEEDSEESKIMASELRKVFKDESPEIQEFSEKFLNIFLTPIPDVKRLAMDIEVNLGPEDFIIPDPQLAKQEIISVSFVSNDGLKLVYVLEREGFSYRKVHKDFPSDAQIFYFKDEKELLKETFRILWEYPIIITFNGDNFDLNYMSHRADKLKIDRDLNPIHVKRGYGLLSKSDCDLRKGVHIDLFNFFFNRSISGYAFGGAYQSASLNAISAALLGRKKYEHEEEIYEMEYDILTWYNLKDSILTLELTQFNNSLVWNLILLLCRITKLPIHEMVRRQISTWIQSIFYFEHRRKHYLIPRRSEISELKKGGKLTSKFDEEKFLGAYVVPPVPGIHYNVVVMDFACFSDDTEILTNDGWFTYGELNNHRNNHIEVATVNPKDNTFEFNPVNKIFEYEYKGKMINFQQQGIDILVTPNHRMIYNKRTNRRDITDFENRIDIKIADKLKDEYLYSIPYTGEWKGKNKFIYIGNKRYKASDFLPFLGWFITDGGISGRSVNIYQSKEHNFDHIRSSIEKLDLQYKEYDRNRPGKKPEKIFSIHNVSFRNSLKNWFIKNLGKYERNRIPPEIFTLEKKDLLLLFESMILGDGRWSENICYTFDTLNKEFADDFQILCLKIGYGCTIKKEKVNVDFNGKIYKRTNYRCLISYERKNIIRRHHTNIADYQGKVWCVSVNNGTVIVRRNGKPFVSGNSLYPSIIKEANLSYETVLCPHEDDKNNFVKGSPYPVCTHKTGIFAYVVGFFRDIRVKFFKPKSSDKNISPKQRSYYQTIQQALKVFINGSYGVFGSQNFPLFCLPVAESTTGIGQYSIKQTIKKAEELGVEVLYGDTDSVFLANPTKQQMKEISEWSKKELDLDLEEEKTYQFLALSQRKKNYVGIYKDTKYIDIKGLVAKKKNTPDFIKKVFNEILNILKNVTNDQEFKKARKRIIEIIKDNRNKIGNPDAFNLEDYTINISIQKDISKYDKVIPQHVRAAIGHQKATGKKYQKGETISFIKSNDKIGAKVLELARFQDLDVSKYRDLLQSALEQVLDALNIEFEEIIYKGYQKRPKKETETKKLDAYF